MKVYFSMARQNGYTVVTVQPKTAWRFDARELARRNKHGVGFDILRGKVSYFQALYPVYYGWFLTSKGSKDLSFTAKVLYYECLKKCQRYRQSVMESIAKSRKESQNQNSDEELVNFFPWSGSKDNHILHCTAKFCNTGRAPGAMQYINRPDVNDTCGKSSTLQIIGFIFSKGTVGARLRLNEEQLSLFDKPEEKERDDINARSAAVYERLGQLNNLLTIKLDIPNMSAQTDRPVTEALPPPVGFGRSAHITVCTAEGVRPNQAIYDGLEVCDIESEGGRLNLVPVMGGMAADLGEGFCTVYLYKPINVSSLFSAYYV